MHSHPHIKTLYMRACTHMYTYTHKLTQTHTHTHAQTDVHKHIKHEHRLARKHACTIQQLAGLQQGSNVHMSKILGNMHNSGMLQLISALCSNMTIKI